MDGWLALVLHAHLPYVRHPEHEEFLEEDWLYEAISETYLPLLEVFDRLADEGVHFRLSMTLTPTLLAMLQDGLLLQRYARRLERLGELAEREVHRTREDAHFHPVAQFYREHLQHLGRLFHQVYRRDLVGAFRRHADAGRLELLTCCATHGFLPLMRDNPQAVRAQVAVGAQAHRHALGSAPRGIWLAECGYFPGVEQVLAREGLRFTFVEAHGLLYGTPPPRSGVYAPVFTPPGVAAFGRDPESSQQVWSAESGYPGHPDYREFYRDIGFDLPLEDVGPWVQPGGGRKNTGFKYHRITGPGPHKEPYRPAVARMRAAEHAEHFAASREAQLAGLSPVLGPSALVVAPYDAELFGHWWFEGPFFLEALLRRLARPDSRVRATTPAEYLQAFPEHQLSTPAPSSWGREGHAAMWLDPVNDWLYAEVNACADAMVALAREASRPTPLEERALTQAARELLLAQASDWAFILRTGTVVEYATRRVREHVDAFRSLESALRRGALEEGAVAAREARTPLFPFLDWRVYRP